MRNIRLLTYQHDHGRLYLANSPGLPVAEDSVLLGFGSFNPADMNFDLMAAVTRTLTGQDPTFQDFTFLWSWDNQQLGHHYVLVESTPSTIEAHSNDDIWGTTKQASWDSNTNTEAKAEEPTPETPVSLPSDFWYSPDSNPHPDFWYAPEETEDLWNTPVSESCGHQSSAGSASTSTNSHSQTHDRKSHSAPKHDDKKGEKTKRVRFRVYELPESEENNYRHDRSSRSGRVDFQGVREVRDHYHYR
ncbi:uncharacterized protein N7496_006545 [Penicillium cataractarum]|uniref:Uncharacterized protein n=1 Tax=Penicillium cataractarum TaxID=2100454 RepID=A0A9W9S6D2_9EURO|nr:uncharacterized protein N7496_006545 [Penicillium cataractarum]KAJ5370453.1 hypothetical protein N7496_006545 [Penicillium cataractarum]